jgi:DNA ligase 1
MNPKFKPMLAATVISFEDLRFPLYASYKFDGIRCYTADLVPPPGDLSVPVSRSLKIIPNMHVRDKIAKLPPGLDGEIMTGQFHDCQSRIMSRQGFPDFKYHVFDYCPNDGWARTPFYERLVRTQDTLIPLMKQFEWLVYVKQELVNNHEELMAVEAQAIESGHEGLILREPNGPYKYGRSTFIEGYLLKVKRFLDSEAEVVGYEPLMRNQNAPEINALGYQERSSHKAHMVPDELLGKLKVVDPKFREEFGIGSGFNMSQRQTMWSDRLNLIGKLVTYKYQPHGSSEDAPRTPIFKGIRSPEDL